MTPITTHTRRPAQRGRYFWLALLWLCILPAAAEQPVDDVRVLIDISGSMQRTDPHNLRQPALRLFTSLLPDGAHAGVWTFGQWTNMLVKNGPVDAGWKAKARAAAGEISSLGRFTNIEDAMRRATWDWKRPEPSVRRSMILLTDGLVDVSKNDAEDAASRRRILQEILPRLQAAGVTLHTIALSGDSDADLLQQLAAATGGWFETIESADGLERLFLRMFEKVVQADSLPLSDNTVDVDNSIREATFLVFRKPGAAPTTITAPDGSRFGRDILPAGVNWYEEERYDLITVQDPPPGQWHINADVDPDNRVMVVTDLRMQHTELPNDLAVGQPVLYTMQLEQAGKIIDRPDFLQFVGVILTQATANGDEWQWRLRDDGKYADLKADDGIFSTRLDETLTAGEHDFSLEVDGITFKRSARQTVKIYGQPVDARLEPLGHGRFAVSVVPYASLIDSHHMSVALEHMLPNGRLQKMTLPQSSTAEWRVELDTAGHPGEHEITLFIDGQRPDGSPLTVHLGPIPFNAEAEAVHARTPIVNPEPEAALHAAPAEVAAEAPPHEPAHEEPAPPAADSHHAAPAETDHAAEAQPSEQPPAEEHAADDQPPQISWGIIIGSIIGLTALIAGLVFGGIKLWPKLQAMREAKQTTKDATPAEPASEAKAESPPPAPAAEPAEEKTPPVANVDQAIDELLGEAEAESAPDPELDLSVTDDLPEEATELEETLEMDEPEPEPKPQPKAKPAAEQDAQTIAEIPEDLLDLGDDASKKA